MTAHDHETDRRLDEALKALGPRIPEPTAPEALRERIDVDLGASGDIQPGRLRLAAHAEVRRLRALVRVLTACAAALALVSTVAIIAAGHYRQELSRRTVTLVPDPGAGDGGLTATLTSRYAVVNFHHSQCPKSRVMTPQFEEMKRRHADEPVDFVTLVMDSPSEASILARSMGFDFAVRTDVLETGVVKLIDRQTGKVIDETPAGGDIQTIEADLQSCVSGSSD